MRDLVLRSTMRCPACACVLAHRLCVVCGWSTGRGRNSRVKVGTRLGASKPKPERLSAAEMALRAEAERLTR